MNQPWVYMCLPTWILLAPPSPSHPSGVSQCTGFECPVSCIELGHMVIIYMFQCYSLKSSHPRLLPQSPKVCSLYLCLFCCLALEKEMATHSSVLAWRIPGMGEPGGLPSVASHRVGHDWSDLAAAAYRVIVTIFLNSIHIHCIGVFLSDLLNSV